MEIINKLRLFIEGLDQRDFVKYLIITLTIIFLLSSVIVFRYYSRVSKLRLLIENVNEIREEQVRSVLQRMDTVEQQRKDVRDILAQEKDFKIADYFASLLKKQRLTENKIEETISTVILANNYQEVILSVKFINMTMKKLCEFLNEIEQKNRVYAKNLEIIKSTKVPKTINVNLAIATLQPQL